jgi:hypothetical protein
MTKAEQELHGLLEIFEKNEKKTELNFVQKIAKTIKGSDSLLETQKENNKLLKKENETLIDALERLLKEQRTQTEETNQKIKNLRKENEKLEKQYDEKLAKTKKSNKLMSL